MEMQNRRPRAGGGGLQIAGSSGGQEEGRQSGRAVPQPQEDHVIVRAIRKMKLVGLRQALKTGISLLERLFWVGVFCVCMWITVELTWMSVEEYLENPTSNTFHDDANINNAPFPGVTVTGTMTFKSSGIQDVLNMLSDSDFGAYARNDDTKTSGPWTYEGLKKLLYTVDHFCEMVSSFASRFSFLDWKKTLDLKSFDKNWLDYLNITLRDDPTDSIMRDNVMPFIRDNTLNCKSILLACMWQGSNEECEDLFVPVQTDIGVGCSFNRIPEDILRSSKGLMTLLRRTKKISDEEWADWKKWDMDVDLKSAIERLRSPRRFPRNQNAAGNMKGLSFLLLHDDMKKLSCPVMSSNGFLIAIHSPFEEPQMMRSAVAVPPGYEVFIKVKGEVTIADKALKSLAIEKRNCLFQGETKLERFSTYTLANCQRECLSRRIVSECGCHQLSMSSGINETICGPLKVECVRNATRDLDQDGYNQLCGDLKCLAPCNDIKYETSVSYMPYHSNNIFKFPQNGTLNLRSNASTSIAHITFESNSLTARERKLLLRLAFLVGIIGGILGMTMNFTVASVFDVVAGLGVLVSPVFDIRRCRRVCSRTNDVEEGSQDPQNEASSNVDDNMTNESDGEVCENNLDDTVDEEVLEEGFDQRLTNLETMVQGLKETLEDLRKNIMKDLRKAVVKNVKKTVTKDLKKTLMKDLKEILMKELKKNSREDESQYTSTIDEFNHCMSGESCDDKPGVSCDDKPGVSCDDEPGISCDDKPGESCEKPDESCDDKADEIGDAMPDEFGDVMLDENDDAMSDESCEISDKKTNDISSATKAPARIFPSRDAGSFDHDTM